VTIGGAIQQGVITNSFNNGTNAQIKRISL